jgi:hypothetical protein
MNLWNFKDKSLTNSCVNFEIMSYKRRQKAGKEVIGFVKCQIHITDDYIFSPVADARGYDILVNDLHSGSHITALTSHSFSTSGARHTTCVTGTSSGTLLLSAGRRSFKVWAPKLTDVEGPANPVHKDNWSDSE